LAHEVQLVGKAGGPRLKVLLLVVLVLSVAAAVARSRSGGAAQYWYDRGIQAAAGSRLDEAALDFQRAIAANIHFAPAYEMLSATYLAQHHMSAALQALDRLRTLQPERSHLYTRIAETYVPVDNLYALRWARQAVLEEPRSPRARILLAAALARSGLGKEALFEMAVASQVSDTPVLKAKFDDAKDLMTDPQKLSALLRTLAPQVPY
jgi:cytochrome c-type biogenesis protein CcmH/NrfG